ncbi:cytochrome b/b6 domain-containing protein [Bacillus aquiflavi]|uniref:Cytochrome b/b6 domain-containing protein n=1 Tax=Bacillus aquiflavi TaxID=2672567 RepID=A0A6B3VYC1_9BACI|nr:cytochrome b/b6 domain-containing protein [Bacillus aquiflavi]MBA4535969.1 cytochrome b/b6 domain-containing protein [Bacillus aquiflavi]NEY80344.1 cytochrome b/b6 domain-containing protein [Bacillus aquiflavi]UAC49793.1 cytochrome b/b6 domain-containing protein [Bacillus aquiflavi]
MKNKQGKVYRQSLSNRLVHWITAISIFSLIISGFGQLPMYKRYNIVKLPGAEWLGEYSLTLIMHYIGAIVLILILFYHLFVHLFLKQFDIVPKPGDIKASYQIIKAMMTKGEEPPSDKYLAEQRLAYFAFAVTLFILVMTGLLKMAKNVSFLNISNSAVTLAAHIHNFATILLILLIIGHFAAFIFKENRSLIPGMFTGYVNEEYAKHRHSLWYKKLQGKK